MKTKTIPIHNRATLVLIAEMFMDECLHVGNRKILQRMIDKALDDGDEDRFQELSAQLRELERSQ